MNQPKKWLEPPLDSKSKLLILNHDYASKHNLEIVNLGYQEYYKEDLLNNFSRIKRVLHKATIRLEKLFQDLRDYCAESYSQYDYVLFQSHDQPVYNTENKSFKEVLEDSYVVISFDIKKFLRPNTTISSFMFNLPNRFAGWNWIQQQQHILQKQKKVFLL
jgi:hypothetical protein